jgi:hypothetical protein
MLDQPVLDSVLAGDVGEVEARGVEEPLGRQVRPVIATHSPDAVTAAASQGVKQRLGIH